MRKFIKSGVVRPNTRAAPKSLYDLDPDDLDTEDVDEFDAVRLEKLPRKKKEYRPPNIPHRLP